MPASAPSSQPSAELPRGLFVPLRAGDPNSPLVVTRPDLEALAKHLVLEREHHGDREADLEKRTRDAEDGQKIAEAKTVEAKLAAILGPIGAAAVAAVVTALIAKLVK